MVPFDTRDKGPTRRNQSEALVLEVGDVNPEESLVCLSGWMVSEAAHVMALQGAG